MFDIKRRLILYLCSDISCEVTIDCLLVFVNNDLSKNIALFVFSDIKSKILKN